MNFFKGIYCHEVLTSPSFINKYVLISKQKNFNYAYNLEIITLKLFIV